MEAILCINHTCVKKDKCARYTRHHKIINKPVKRFDCKKSDNMFEEL